METMTEEQVVEQFGPIRYYLIGISKMTDGRRPGWGRVWHHSQSISCYSKEELSAKLEELEVRKTRMNKLTEIGKPIPCYAVRWAVWPIVRGFGSSGRRHAAFGIGRHVELKPIFYREHSFE